MAQAITDSISRKPARSAGGYNPLARLSRSGVQAGIQRLLGDRVRIEEGSSGEKTTELEIRVHDQDFYRKVAWGGSVGAADSYIAGDWSTNDLVGLFREFTKARKQGRNLSSPLAFLQNQVERFQHWFRRNSRAGSRRNIMSHYDLGNDFFQLVLDPSMTYSCGCFDQPTQDLETAQENKYEYLCQLLQLDSGDHLLEIGTGWCGMAIHAARHHGCRVTTTTISSQQHQYAVEAVRKAGLQDRIEVLLQDYRELDGQYDNLVSIEMIEAVGHRYLPVFFASCHSLLKNGGSMALQAISMPDSEYPRYLKRADFIQTHVFPGSCCPSLGAMLSAVAKTTRFSLESCRNIGLDYAETLRRWRLNSVQNDNRIRSLGYSDEFLRLWEYYLCYCEAGFAEKYIATHQMLLTKGA